MNRRLRTWTALLVSGVPMLVCAAAFLWWAYRGQPDPVRERWYRGVDYERVVLQHPRPVVAHVVRIDLTEPGIDFVVTPPEPSPAGDVRSATTSAFLEREGLEVAINASYFYPFHNEHPLDYQPHPGQRGAHAPGSRRPAYCAWACPPQSSSTAAAPPRWRDASATRPSS